MNWKAGLDEALGARVVSATPAGGGDINDTFHVTLSDDREVFVKTHHRPPPGMYAAEADGLAWLSAGPLRVPRVIAVTDQALALEWLELSARGSGIASRDIEAFDEALGRGLAQLHQLGADGFGYPRTNYLATIAQDAVRETDGPTFWIDHRVRPLCARARARGAIPDVSARLDTLLAKRDRFGPVEPPARLHGDLWWGNVVAVDGAPCLIDPAVYGGHREVDLAMLSLFGSVSSTLLDAYRAVLPLADGWRDRVSLWQLYPIAAHAVLFGGGYGARLSRILDSLQ